MREPERVNGQSTEVNTVVKNVFSDGQKNELRQILGQIIESSGLKISEESIVECLPIVEDCIYKGLEQDHKEWFSTADSIAPTFTKGLNRRKEVLDRLNKYADNAPILHFISGEEVNTSRAFSALSTNFSDAEDLLSVFEEKHTEVAKFHTLLFEKSHLTPQAQSLRTEMSNQRFTPPNSFDDDNKLYQNLLVHTALYQEVGLNIELEDMAALNELWTDTNVRERTQDRLIDTFKKLAKSNNLSEEVIVDYTKGILDTIGLSLGKALTLDALINSGNFVFSRKNIEQVGSQIQQEAEGNTNQIVTITKKDLDKVKRKLTAFQSLYKGISENEGSNLGMNKRLTQLLNTINGLDLIYFLGSDIDVNMERELMEVISLETLTQGLETTYAQSIQIQDNTEAVEQLSAYRLEETGQKIKQKLLNVLMDEESSELDQYSLLNSLPAIFLGEFLTSINPQSLKEDQINSVLEMDGQKWLQICLDRNVSIPVDPNNEALADFEFPPGSSQLEFYIYKMPMQKRQELADRLRRTVTF